MREPLKDTITRLLVRAPRSIQGGGAVTPIYDVVVRDLIAGLEPISDALYYEPCPLCGDSRFTADPLAPEPEPGKVYAVPPNATPEELGFVSCPKCADRTPFVIAAARYLAAQIALRAALRIAGYQGGRRTSPLIDAVLAAALGEAPVVPLAMWKGTLEIGHPNDLPGGVEFLTVTLDEAGSREDALSQAREGAQVLVAFLGPCVKGQSVDAGTEGADTDEV